MFNIMTVTGGEYQTNCYILELNNEVVLIDFVQEAEEFILNNNFKVNKVLLTHIHFDHIIGLSEFQEKHNFELVMSENAFKNINNPEYNLLSFLPDYIRTVFKGINLKNSVVLKNNDIINWNDRQIRLIESPGHTDDSVIYIIDSMKSAFTGDTIFKCGIGRTDFHNGDYNKIISSIINFLKITEDDYILYPGHGPHTNVLFEKKNNPFIQEFI